MESVKCKITCQSSHAPDSSHMMVDMSQSLSKYIKCAVIAVACTRAHTHMHTHTHTQAHIHRQIFQL